MYEQLVEAVRSVVIPGAPPRLSQTGAAIGLSFLETVLRQNHTRRLTEQVILVNATSAQRVLRQEVSLSFLTPEQIRLSAKYNEVRSNQSAGGTQPRSATNDLWVPLSRIPRKGCPSITVTASDGSPVPTLTRGESSDLFGPAIYRLVKRVIVTNSGVEGTQQLKTLLMKEHEARWLLQQAILSLVGERAPAPQRSQPAHVGGTAAATGAKQRQVVLLALAELHSRDQLTDILDLLSVAVNDQVLIGALDSRVDTHQLSYTLPIEWESPRSPDRRTTLVSRLGARVKTFMQTADQDYLVRYETHVPSGIESYHVSITVGEGTRIANAALVAESISGECERIARDLEYLAVMKSQQDSGRLEALDSKLLERELQHTLKRLAEIVRRRRWEAAWLGAELNGDGLKAAGELADAASSGEGFVEADTGKVHASLLMHPIITVDRLGACARQIREAQIGSDVTMDRPRDAGTTNLNWRRSESTPGHRSADIPTKCFLRCVDGSHFRMRSIALFGLAVIAVSYGMAAATFSNPAFWNWIGDSTSARIVDADAKVAVVLLVPGFLFTRLNFPPRSTIAAWLMVWPRIVAYGFIGSSIVMAIGIAWGSGPGDAIVCLIALTFQVTLEAVLLTSSYRLLRARRRDAATEPVGNSALLPPWIRPPYANQFFPPIDGRFKAVQVASRRTI